MADFGWGLGMMGAGMGTVFLMLLFLMAALAVLNYSDREPKPAVEAAPSAPELTDTDHRDEGASVEEDSNAWMTIADASGLTPEQIAAVSVAVAVHADVRRKQGAPVNRVYAPGSRLWASRWVSMGRNAQMRNTQRR